MISTRGRYSLRIMLDIACNSSTGHVPMRDVAKRQGISLKYIERLMPALRTAKLVESCHGAGGGYRLTRAPGEYTLWEILECAEGDLAPVACLQKDAERCERAEGCRTLPVWKGFYDMTREYFSGMTLADLTADVIEDL